MTRALLVLAAVICLARTAAAAPLVDLDTGGMVFVGPTSAHPTAIYWNPAAGGLQRGLHVWFNTSARFDYLQIDRAPIDTGDGEPDDAPVGTPVKRFDSVAATTFAPGTYLGLIYDFNNEKITGGIAFYTPFVDVGPSGKDALRYHTRGNNLRALVGSAAVSYRPWRYLILGAGVNLLLAEMHLGFSLDEGLEACEAAPCAGGVENAAQTSDFNLDASTGLSPAIAFTFGTIYIPSPTLKFALVYHSSPGLGKLTLSGDADVTPAGGGAQVHGDAQIYMELPQSLQLGLAWDAVPGRLQVVSSLTWIDLSVGSQLDLRMAGPELRGAGVNEWVLRYRGLRDVLVLDVGIEKPSDARLRLGARVRVESGSTEPSHVSPQQVDAPSLSLMGGLETGIGGGVSLTLGVRAGVMLPTSVTDSAFKPSEAIDCRASGFDLDACEAAREGRAIPTAAGDYLHFNYGFMLGLAYDRL